MVHLDFLKCKYNEEYGIFNLKLYNVCCIYNKNNINYGLDCLTMCFFMVTFALKKY